MIDFMLNRLALFTLLFLHLFSLPVHGKKFLDNENGRIECFSIEQRLPSIRDCNSAIGKMPAVSTRAQYYPVGELREMSLPVDFHFGHCMIRVKLFKSRKGKSPLTPDVDQLLHAQVWSRARYAVKTILDKCMILRNQIGKYKAPRVEANNWSLDWEVEFYRTLDDAPPGGDIYYPFSRHRLGLPNRDPRRAGKNIVEISHLPKPPTIVDVQESDSSEIDSSESHSPPYRRQRIS
jgi:hypothetical protein